MPKLPGSIQKRTCQKRTVSEIPGILFDRKKVLWTYAVRLMRCRHDNWVVDSTTGVNSGFRAADEPVKPPGAGPPGRGRHMEDGPSPRAAIQCASKPHQTGCGKVTALPSFYVTGNISVDLPITERSAPDRGLVVCR